MRLASLFAALLLASCVNKDGEDLPDAQLAFPIAIELSPRTNGNGEPKYAFVANSNFDLAYNSGSVQSYDLGVMVEAVDTVFEICQCDEEAKDPCDELGRACDAPGVQCDTLRNRCGTLGTEDCKPIPADRCAIYPSELDFEQQEERQDVLAVPIEDLLISEVRMGSFADGMALAENAAPDGDRLYLPVRSDANLTFIDTNEAGQLDCGSGFEAAYQLCQQPYRSGDLELVNEGADISVPPDPVDVYAGSLEEDFPLPNGVEPTGDYSGQYVIMAHRDAAASFFLDQEVRYDEEGKEIQGEKRPRLVATIDELAQEQVTVTYEPDARVAWIPSANSNAVSRVGIALGSDPAQTVLFDEGPLVMSGLDSGIDARDVAFDPRPANAERAYVLSRSPESILVTTRDPLGDELIFVPPQLPICRGPSRLQLELIELEGGAERLLGFVTCFNGRRVEIVDLDEARSFTRITNVSGAFEFEIDQSRQRMYLADFSTSTLRVFDLAPLLACLSSQSPDSKEECAPTLRGIVGIPQAVSELPR